MRAQRRTTRTHPPPPTSKRSLLGALAHLGPAPSAEDIDEVRREVWGGVPPQAETE